MATQPGKLIKRITDLGTIIQTVFADLAGVIRVSEAGMDWAPLGLISSAVRVGENQPILVYNNSGSVAYVKFGDQSVSAPTGPTDGIPIANLEKFVVNSGSSAWIRSSAGNIYGYIADHD